MLWIFPCSSHTRYYINIGVGKSLVPSAVAVPFGFGESLVEIVTSLNGEVERYTYGVLGIHNGGREYAAVGCHPGLW